LGFVIADLDPSRHYKLEKIDLSGEQAFSRDRSLEFHRHQRKLPPPLSKPPNNSVRTKIRESTVRRTEPFGVSRSLGFPNLAQANAARKLIRAIIAY